jgi:hypothetical protein
MNEWQVLGRASEANYDQSGRETEAAGRKGNGSFGQAGRRSGHSHPHGHRHLTCRRYVAFQMAEVSIPRNLFTAILRLMAELRPPLAASTA